MTNTYIRDNLIAQLERLPYNLQLRVLDSAKTLIPKGVERKSLILRSLLNNPSIKHPYNPSKS